MAGHSAVLTGGTSPGRPSRGGTVLLEGRQGNTLGVPAGAGPGHPAGRSWPSHSAESSQALGAGPRWKEPNPGSFPPLCFCPAVCPQGLWFTPQGTVTQAQGTAMCLAPGHAGGHAGSPAPTPAPSPHPPLLISRGGVFTGESTQGVGYAPPSFSTSPALSPAQRDLPRLGPGLLGNHHGPASIPLLTHLTLPTLPTTKTASVDACLHSLNCLCLDFAISQEPRTLWGHLLPLSLFPEALPLSRVLGPLQVRSPGELHNHPRP